MVANRQHSRNCCCVSLCWLSSRSLWQTLHCPVWIALHLYRMRPRCLRSYICSAARRYGFIWRRRCSWRTHWTGWVCPTTHVSQCMLTLFRLAEIVPVKYRGYSLALVTAFVLPFCPYLLYVELWSHHDTKVGWRWGPWCALIYNGIVGLGLLFTYFPHNHTRTEGFSRAAILKRIDFVGGILSITGLTLL